MTHLQRIRKVLPLLRRFLKDSAREWDEVHRGREPYGLDLWQWVYFDLANLRMWLKDSAGIILRVERALKKRRVDYSVLLREKVLDRTYELEVWVHDAPKADNPIPVTDSPGPSSSHYGITPSNHDTVSYLNNADQQMSHAAAERRARNEEDDI